MTAEILSFPIARREPRIEIDCPCVECVEFFSTLEDGCSGEAVKQMDLFIQWLFDEVLQP